MWWLPYWTAAVVLGGVLGGYLIGRRHERECATAEAERLLLLDPPARTPGLPTNRDAEPSVVKTPRVARSHLMR